MSRLRASLLVLAAAGALALSACAPGALDPEPSTTAAPTVGPPSDAPDDPDPSGFDPEPSVPPTIDPVVGDLDLACDAVLTPQQVYDFNPQMYATDSPSSGVPAGFAALADDGGVVCAWEHVSSGDVLLVGVAEAADAPSGDLDAGGIASRSGVQGDWYVAVASPYFQGADEQGDAMLADVAANLP